MHLAAASTLIPTLVHMVSISPSSTSSGHENRRQDDSAIRFLLGSFILIDIISCATMRSSHILELDHKIMLERVGIRLENLIGCRNWVITFIFEISLLDQWKREAEKVYKLSIVELAKRGRQIEERLQVKLAGIENEASSNTSGISLESTYTEITKIFALSALTYLHVVISGTYPELPEIIESVSKTIGAFQDLTDPKLLRYLAWPFCITGCLALDSQHAIFRNIFSAAEVTKSTVGTYFEAFKIIEACWEIRKTCPYDCDWVSVMRKWGYYVLLS
jgi:hypothetical protein